VLLFLGLFYSLCISISTSPEFEEFKILYNKSYNPSEISSKFQTFSRNLQYINEHNSNPRSSFKLKMNHLGDLTHKEFLHPIQVKSKGISWEGSGIPLPPSFDWRTKGAVGPVKNQGQCGNPEMFTTIESVDGCHFINTGSFVETSVQQLIDCATQNEGCDGGFIDNEGAYIYIMQNGGIDSESCYPFTDNSQTCKYKPSCCASTVGGYVNIISGNETSLQEGVFRNPVAVAIDASQSSFQFYTSGVYYDPGCSSTELDHGVLVVGWGSLAGTPYWIAKNSWGDDWGLSGYILMSRNKGNNCGIATSAIFPINCKNC